jgi:hypothetical protein
MATWVLSCVICAVASLALNCPRHTATHDEAAFMPSKLRSPTGGGSSSVSLFDHGLVQVLQAAVATLEPKRPYVLAPAGQPDRTDTMEPLSGFATSQAGSAIVNAIGPIRQIVQNGADERHHLTLLSGSADETGAPVQVEVP